MIEVAIGKRLGAFALDVSFASAAPVTALFGPSGAGKTSVLAAIAGLARLDRGRIELGGRVLADSDRRIHLPPHRRRIGYVYQDAQLFPHMSVARNLDYGAAFAPAEAVRPDRDRVTAALGIGHLLARRPVALSGGEKARVAIGRALLSAPRLLLMDEPLASLDRALKREILTLIEDVVATFGVPVLYVSHAIEEVARLASHVVVIDHGRVVASGTPEAVLLASAGDDAAPVSIISGAIGSGGDFGLVAVEHPAGRLYLPQPRSAPGRKVRVLMRATDIAVALTPPQGLSIRNVLGGEIEAISGGFGPTALVRVRLPGGDVVTASITRAAVAELALAPGMAVHLLVKSVALAGAQ